MRQKFEDFKDWWSDFLSDPKNKGKRIAIFSAIGVVAVALVAVLAVNLKNMSRQAQDVSAAELIDGQSALTERNAAGGVIADIDWDTIIGYDKDGNPIYGTFNMVPTVGGYDMCGAPIYKDDMVVTGMAEDGLPIYGNYSAIEQARIRGLKSGNTDIDWDTIVAYDADGNPIFGSKGGDPNIIGYDMLGNPIYKGSVTIIGRTDSGLPIYNYSTIKVAKVAGKEAQNALGKSDSTTGVDGLAKELAAKNTKGLTAEQIKALINSYLADGVITDDEMADLASKTGLSIEMIKQLLEKYGVGNTSSSGTGLNGTANISVADSPIKDTIDTSKKKSSSSEGELSEMSKLIKELANKSGLSEDEVRRLLSKYMSDGELTSDELAALAKELGISESELKKLIENYGVGSVTTKSGTSGTNGKSGSDGSNGTSGKSGLDGSSGVNGGRGISGSDGSNGTSGTSGLSGTSGIKGDTGATGAAGRDGKDGKDATSTMHTVTFNSNGGSAVGNQKVVHGGTAVKPGDPRRDGYEFDGWYIGSTLYNFSNSVNNDLSLTAKWREKAYSITYDNVDGAMNVPSVTGYTVTTDTFTLSQPELDGYTFQGWSGTGLSGLTKEVTIAKGSSGDRRYKANWNVIRPKISFDWNLSDDMVTKHESAAGTLRQFTFPKTATITGTFGKPYSTAVDASEDLDEWPDIRNNLEVYGYYFKGWYVEGTDDDGVLHKYLIKEYSTVYLTEDTTLVAEWEKSPYVTYKVNYWFQTVESAKASGEYAPHDETNFVRYTPEGFQDAMSEKEGYSATPAPGDVSGFNTPTPVSKIITVDSATGKGTEFDYYYTRQQFSLNVARKNEIDTINDVTSGITELYYYEEPVSVSIKSKAGYKIKEDLDPDPSDLQLQKSGTSEAMTVSFNMPAKNVILRPDSTPIEYKIHYDANGGSGTMQDDTAYYGIMSDLSDCTYTKTGYHFVGWGNTSSLSSATLVWGEGNVSNIYRDDLAKTDTKANEKANGAVGINRVGSTNLPIPGKSLCLNENDVYTMYALWAKDAYTVEVVNGSDVDTYRINVAGGKPNAVTSMTIDGANVSKKRVDQGDSVTIAATLYGTENADGTSTFTDDFWTYIGVDGTYDTADDKWSGTDLTDAGDKRHKKEHKYTFTKWELVGASAASSTEKSYTFVMPTNAVTATSRASCSVTGVKRQKYGPASRYVVHETPEFYRFVGTAQCPCPSHQGSFTIDHIQTDAAWGSCHWSCFVTTKNQFHRQWYNNEYTPCNVWIYYKFSNGDTGSYHFVSDGSQRFEDVVAADFAKDITKWKDGWINE